MRAEEEMARHVLLCLAYLAQAVATVGIVLVAVRSAVETVVRRGGWSVL